MQIKYYPYYYVFYFRMSFFGNYEYSEPRLIQECERRRFLAPVHRVGDNCVYHPPVGNIGITCIGIFRIKASFIGICEGSNPYIVGTHHHALFECNRKENKGNRKMQGDVVMKYWFPEGIPPFFADAHPQFVFDPM